MFVVVCYCNKISIKVKVVGWGKKKRKTLFNQQMQTSFCKEKERKEKKIADI